VLDFFYESLETLKEVKKPSKNEVFKMTVAVLVIVTVA
jgi:preprotein translocase subunit SecE